MMLTMMECLDKIPYVVDSFKEKLYLYAPVTHKHILPLEQLVDQPAEAIVIIVGWQYREVLKRIEELNLNPKPAIALIRKATLEIL